MRVVLALLLCACQETKIAEPVKQMGDWPKSSVDAPREAPTEGGTSGRLKSGKATDEDLRFAVAAAKTNQKITFAHLKKNADKYKGEIWRFKGRVLEIAEEDGTTTARIAADYYGNQVLYVLANFETEFVEGNPVDVMGLLAGTYSYTSQAGWNITIPAMVAFVIDKPGALDKRLGLKKRGSE